MKTQKSRTITSNQTDTWWYLNFSVHSPYMPLPPNFISSHPEDVILAIWKEGTGIQVFLGFTLINSQLLAVIQQRYSTHKWGLKRWVWIWMRFLKPCACNPPMHGLVNGGGRLRISFLLPRNWDGRSVSHPELSTLVALKFIKHYPPLLSNHLAITIVNDNCLTLTWLSVTSHWLTIRLVYPWLHRSSCVALMKMTGRSPSRSGSSVRGLGRLTESSWGFMVLRFLGLCSWFGPGFLVIWFPGSGYGFEVLGFVIAKI